jgi:hypothetical protein
VYVCVYVCVCMFICMYIYVCMYACIYACMYVCIYVCVYVYMHVCMYVYMHVCMYVRMYVSYQSQSRMIYSIVSYLWCVLYSFTKLRHLEHSENIYCIKLFRYLLIYSNICLGNKIYIPYKLQKSRCYLGLFEILYKEDFILLRSFYDRNAKWIPKGTVMHGSNILPQIIN